MDKMDRAFGGLSVLLPYALSGLLTVEVLLGIKTFYLRFQAARRQAIAAHSVELEVQDGGGYRVAE